MQRGVPFARDKREAIRFVEHEAVRMIRSRERIALNDSLAHRIDRDQLVLRLHGDENAVRDGIVVRVAGLTTERDGRSFRASRRIDHDVRVARLVGDEHLVRAARVRDAVGKANVADARRHLERSVIDDRDFVVAGRRDVDLW